MQPDSGILSAVRRASITAIVALLAASAAAGATHPTLRVVRMNPLVVRGSSFHPSERVRVTLRFRTTIRMRSTRTSRTGTFSVDLGAVAGYDPCNDSLAVSAMGATGDRAAVKIPQRMCPPALTP
jgi:hypothetical protein